MSRWWVDYWVVIYGDDQSCLLNACTTLEVVEYARGKLGSYFHSYTPIARR